MLGAGTKLLVSSVTIMAPHESAIAKPQVEPVEVGDQVRTHSDGGSEVRSHPESDPKGTNSHCYQLPTRILNLIPFDSVE
jgi:hypothetical protein